MGKKVQGAKLRAFKRSKVALEELQERQAEDAVLVNTDDLFVIDRTGTDNVPHHLRPSKVHKATATGTKNAKFARNYLSSIDERKVQKLLQQQQQHPSQQRPSKTSNRRRNTSGIKNQKTNFDLWQDETSNRPVGGTTDMEVSTASHDTSIVPRTATTTVTAPASAATTSSSIVPRAVKLTAEGIRNIVVSTATAIKDGIMNRLMTQTAPTGIAPLPVVTKALPTSITNKIKNPLITKVIDNTTHLIPIEKKKVAIDTSLTGGQSYHPDPIQHKQLLQQAIQMEVARNRALENAIAPISSGLSEETRAILMQDDDSEYDEDDNNKNTDDGNQSSMAVGEIPKRLNKLTTAQRNKQKLLRQQEVVLRLQKKEKKLLNDGEIPKYRKDIKRQQQASIQKQLQKIQHHQSKLHTNPLGSKLEILQSHSNPLLAPTLPIALLDKTKQQASSLRTIQPKGSMMVDRAYSLSSRHPSVSPIIPTKHDTSSAARASSVAAAAMTKPKLAPHKHRKKRKLSLKGKRNSSTRGDDFEILG